jgi:hypothetical protein
VVDVGKLTLVVVRDGNSLGTTEIRSTRPMAAQVLKGKSPAQVIQIVPLLFSVCGRAQGAAAGAALQAAQQGGPVISAAMERMIVCESMQEHLWRVMLDWPRLLGLPQQDQRFAGWYAMLRRISVGTIEMPAFLTEFERDGLGMPLAEWRRMNSYAALQSWWRKTESPVAQLLSALDELESGKHSPKKLRLLPAWMAAEAQQACAGKWDAGFSARPEWQDAAAETGAWTYYADMPLLQDVWQQSGSAALTRLLARIWDLLEMAGGNAIQRLDADSPEAGEGIAVVRTARGLLMHHVCLAEDKVTDYQIVAPTEWNFHPEGAFAQDLRGLAVPDEERLKQLVHIEAMSLDPCVAYEVEVRTSHA